MSSLPDVPLDARAQALNFLKGKENPFASLARPQRLDDFFLDLHVPRLLAGEREQIWRIIDCYRVEEYTRTADLPATAVVSILGDRGSGKTHLLQSLSYREDRKSQILVRPSFLFEKDLQIEEYLLARIIATLLERDDVYRTRPIDDLADAMTRRLLRQTLRSLGPTERLFATRPGRWRRWQLLLGGGNRIHRNLENLTADLEKPWTRTELAQLLGKYGLTAEHGYRLLSGHLRRFEGKRRNLLSGLRLGLYAAMAEAALLGADDTLLRFLEGEYAQVEGGDGPRFEVAGKLLQAIIEATALIRQPIVICFDNFERLFSPNNELDGGLVRAFWSSLAQAVDNTKGLLILLFAEDSLFDKAASFMDSFAQDRLRQGVPLAGHGPISTIPLRPPAPDELRILIKERVGRLLGKLGENLPDGFPFDAEFLEKEASASQNLRITLSRLRDEYSFQVYGQARPAASIRATGPGGSSVGGKKPAIEWNRLLETSWKEQFAAAGRQHTAAQHRSALHAGLGCLLQSALPLAASGWELASVEPSLPIGENTSYGVVSLLHWRHAGAGNGAVTKVGVGFLLASGPGLSFDLQAKFDFFQKPARGDQLLVLYPAAHDKDDLAGNLPAKTREVWTSSRWKKKATLRRIDENDLRTLRAFSEWLNALSNQSDEPVPAPVLKAFVAERFQAQFELVVPAEMSKERSVADED